MQQIHSQAKQQLVIISHTPHYIHNGITVGTGSTVREIDQLASLFASVIHLAPLHAEMPPPSARPYQAPNVQLQPVSPAGGKSIWAKLGILLRLRQYVPAIVQVLRIADVVHVRCPANISLITLIIQSLRRSPATNWVKYAGNWNPAGSEPWSYTFQRWWLNHRLYKGIVTVNGEWPDQPAHVISFVNPSLTDDELEAGQLALTKKRLVQPVQLLFVGRLENEKGPERVIAIAAALTNKGISVELNLIGEGPDSHKCEQKVAALGLEDQINLHGALPRQSINRYYEKAHFLVLPSMSEGWPKVLSEGMAYGVLPLASRAGSIPWYLEKAKTGLAIVYDQTDDYVAAIIDYVGQPERWLEEAWRAIHFAAQFSYNHYLKQVKTLLFKGYDL